MKDRLKEIVISVTNRCNLSCAMCEIPKQDFQELSTEEAHTLIADAANLNPNSIVFSGGEPLLRKDIFDLISFTNSLKINTCLTSNGVLIDDELAKQLYFSGIGIVNISIEGPEEVHDFLRGKGSFQKAISALKSLSRHKIETTIASLVCRHNYDSLAYVMELAHQYGVTTVKFQPFSEIFLVEKNKSKDFFVPQDDFIKLKDSMEKIKGLSNKYRIATNPYRYLDAIPFYLCRMGNNQWRNKCLAIWHSCPISADGSVYLCWVLSKNILGNIKGNKLSEIWNSPKHEKWRNGIIKKGCSGCLMSCYDYNFSEDILRLFSLKVNKLNKPNFYKRQFHRINQYLQYNLKRVSRRIASLRIFCRKKIQKPIAVLDELSTAKDILKKKLQNLNQNGRS